MARTFASVVHNVVPPASGGTSALQALADSLAPGDYGILPTPTWNGSTYTMYASWVSRGYRDDVNNRLVVYTKEPGLGSDGEAHLQLYDITTDTWTNPYNGIPNTNQSETKGHPWEVWGVRGDTGQVVWWEYTSASQSTVKWTGMSTGAWAADSTHSGVSGPGNYGLGMAWHRWLGSATTDADPGWVVVTRNAVYARRAGFSGNLSSYKIMDLTPSISSTDGLYNNVLAWPERKGVLVSRWNVDSGGTVKSWLIKNGVGGALPTWEAMPNLPIPYVGCGSNTGPQGKMIMSTNGEVPLIIATEKYTTPGFVWALQYDQFGYFGWTGTNIIAPFHNTTVNPRGNRPYLISCPTEGVVVGLINTGSGGDYQPSPINMVVWKPPIILESQVGI